jgi:hypothetical protein
LGHSKRLALRSAAFEEAISSCAIQMGEQHPPPVHSGETIGPGLLYKILRDAHMSREELLELLRQ